MTTPAPSLSSTLNSHSSGKLEEIITAKGVQEFREESEFSCDLNFEGEEASGERAQEQTQVEEEVNDGDFEFAFICTEPNSSLISADEIFHNGQIRRTCRIFDRDLLAESDGSNSSLKIALSELFSENRVSTSSSSSEVDGVQPEKYCDWTQKVESQGSSKKSNSTGMLKRWKFRNLLHWSNSDKYVFVTPLNANSKKRADNVEKATMAAREAHYVKEDDRQRGRIYRSGKIW